MLKLQVFFKILHKIVFIKREDAARFGDSAGGLAGSDYINIFN